MVNVQGCWTILILAMALGSSKVEATDTDKYCITSYVSFDSNQTEEVQCQHQLGYDFNDGGVLSVKPGPNQYSEGIYQLVLKEPEKFTIQDKAGCPINDLGNRVHTISILLAPDFNSEKGCGISVSGSYLWGAIALDTEKVSGDSGETEKTGRVIFPIEKTPGNSSDISLTTAQSIAQAGGEYVDVDIAQFHKLGAVPSSGKAFGYMFYDYLAVKMFLDVPIRITEECYNVLTSGYDPAPVSGVYECSDVFKLLGNGSLLGKPNTMLVSITLSLVSFVNWVSK